MMDWSSISIDWNIVFYCLLGCCNLGLTIYLYRMAEDFPSYLVDLSLWQRRAFTGLFMAITTATGCINFLAGYEHLQRTDSPIVLLFLTGAIDMPISDALFVTTTFLSGFFNFLATWACIGFPLFRKTNSPDRRRILEMAEKIEYPIQIFGAAEKSIV